MTTRPILFSGPMVRAILAGTKMQTRRKLKFQEWNDAIIKRHPRQKADVPFAVGDILWVRETWAAPHGFDTLKPSEIENGMPVHYAATAELGGTNNLGGLIGRPSIFMPRWASRLTLEVTDVRVERLNDISHEDALAEGVTKIRDHCYVIKGFDYDTAGLCHSSPVTPYAKLWDHINGDGAWEANPFVVAVSFNVHKCNVDAFARSEAA